MRIISWTVVIGSITAILYGGVRPLLEDVRLPAIDASQVAGTAARPAVSEMRNCADAKRPADRAGQAEKQPAACDEPTPAKR